jgi:hypothetical protein
MRLGSLLLLTACLLLGPTFASAEPADTPAIAPPASAPDQADPFCVESPSQPESLSFIPDPTFKAGSPCGSCSASNCQGLNINASCYYLSAGVYRIGKCYADSVCSSEGFSAYCRCRTGPEL